MKHRQDNDTLFLYAKIDAVWETMGDNAPNVCTNNGKLERMFRCQQYATVDLGYEFKSKAKSFALVPCICIDELCTGGTMKSNG
ncbi:MAG: hypothetical protein Q7U37_11385 [Gallionella sp.]|nr:hypothetical protein [Gallionella sp.]